MDSWIDTDYYHPDRFHPMQMTYDPSGHTQSEHHGQIHGNDKTDKVYIPAEHEALPDQVPNRRKPVQKSQQYGGNTYFRRIFG